MSSAIDEETCSRFAPYQPDWAADQTLKQLIEQSTLMTPPYNPDEAVEEEEPAVITPAQQKNTIEPGSRTST